MTFKQLREKSGLTTECGAKMLGIKPQTLNKYENAIRNPSPNIMLKMTEIYNCTHADVMKAYKENLGKAVKKYGKLNP